MKMLLPRMDEDELVRLRAAAPAVELVTAATREEALALAPGVEAAYGWCEPALVRAAPRLRWIQVGSAGVEGYLFPELVESPITLTNARAIYGIQLADHAMALILAFARELPELLRRQQAACWDDRRGLHSVELQGQTLLVVGLGGTGVELARRAAAFGMRVVATRRHPGRPLSVGVERVEPPTALHDLLPAADYVAICCPLTPETRHLFGAAELARMKPTGVLVNVTRGGVVDHAALLESLQAGRLGGAGLDVTDPEPLPPDSPLWRLRHVIITPHSSGQSQGAGPRMLALLQDNLRRFAAGEPLLCVVDKTLGY
jgi:phosphoglycerate dehydrogenase-like enzyme